MWYIQEEYLLQIYDQNSFKDQTQGTYVKNIY